MRSKSGMKSDYDEAARSYDGVRFGSPGGTYADRTEKALLARVVKGRTALEIGTATEDLQCYFSKWVSSTRT
jgi:hypothetical protein